MCTRYVTVSQSYLRIRWRDQDRDPERVDLQHKTGPTFSNGSVGWVSAGEGRTVLCGWGFRTPCCVINNFLDSMYSPLSPFPKKAAVSMTVGCRAKKITDSWFAHTHTHTRTFWFPCMAPCCRRNTGTERLSICIPVWDKVKCVYSSRAI